MRIWRFIPTTLAVTIFSLGMIAAQVCNSVCDFSLRHNSTAFNLSKPATKQKAHGHCHGDAPASKSDAPSDSDRCPSHQTSIASTPLIQSLLESLRDQTPVAIIEPFTPAADLIVYVGETERTIHLRPPPRETRRLNLRI